MPRRNAGATVPPSQANQVTRLRLVVALGAVLASAGCIAASTLGWLIRSDQAGGVASVSGWGKVSGGQIDGQNINDLIAGQATFRPGTISVIVGGLALAAALAVALVSRGSTPHRIPAAVLVLCGLGGLAWGIIRVVAPDSLDLGGGTAGVGPWLTAGCSLALLAAAVVVFTGVLDPPPPQNRHRRGIQPR